MAHGNGDGRGGDGVAIAVLAGELEAVRMEGVLLLDRTGTVGQGNHVVVDVLEDVVHGARRVVLGHRLIDIAVDPLTVSCSTTCGETSTLRPGSQDLVSTTIYRTIQYRSSK
jgi:hypothetical protein